MRPSVGNARPATVVDEYLLAADHDVVRVGGVDGEVVDGGVLGAGVRSPYRYRIAGLVAELVSGLEFDRRDPAPTGDVELVSVGGRNRRGWTAAPGTGADQGQVDQDLVAGTLDRRGYLLRLRRLG